MQIGYKKNRIMVNVNVSANSITNSKKIITDMPKHVIVRKVGIPKV